MKEQIFLQKSKETQGKRAEDLNIQKRAFPR